MKKQLFTTSKKIIMLPLYFTLTEEAFVVLDFNKFYLYMKSNTIGTYLTIK